MQLVVYYRVSTDKQERSGLGIEAQRAAVREYARRTGARVLTRYTETESGRRADRPQLAKALAHARRSRARLVVAKLDRLSRNLAFLDSLQRSKVDFAALDCEHANKMTLQIMMVMAEHEAEATSARTKAALAARRERGLPLGAENPNCRNLTRMAEGRAMGRDAQAAASRDAYSDLIDDMREWRDSGESYQAIADRLNDQGHTTRTGRPWRKGYVHRILARLS